MRIGTGRKSPYELAATFVIVTQYGAVVEHRVEECLSAKGDALVVAALSDGGGESAA